MDGLCLCQVQWLASPRPGLPSCTPPTIKQQAPGLNFAAWSCFAVFLGSWGLWVGSVLAAVLPGPTPESASRHTGNPPCKAERGPGEVRNCALR